jgi:hypothetical protein
MYRTPHEKKVWGEGFNCAGGLSLILLGLAMVVDQIVH